MVAYEFYWLDPKGGYQIVRVLPENRKNPERITQKFIMQWGENIFGKDLNTKDIYFIQVTINADTGNIFRPTPFFITQKKAKKEIHIECEEGKGRVKWLCLFCLFPSVIVGSKINLPL